MLISVLIFISSSLYSVGFRFSSESCGLSFIDSNSKFVVDNSVNITQGFLNLKDNAATTVSNSSTVYNINFSNGIFKTANSSCKLSGVIDPTSTETITLNNGNSLDVTSGTVLQTLAIANGATATIFGQPAFSSAITLGNASSVLQVSITTPLNQSVTGSGKLKLLNDLIVAKDVALPSLVEQQGKKMYFNGGTYSTAVTNTTGGVIELGANIALSNLWTIGTGADVYTLTGNGNIITFSGTGGITFNGTTLNIADVHIKNMSTTNALKGSGAIYLSNVTLELSANFTRSDGSFFIVGDNCRVITNGYTFTISGSGNTITINGQMLQYSQLDGTGLSPFATASSGAIVKLNGGDISAGGGGSGISSAVFSSTSNTLNGNVWLASSAVLRFVNSTPLTPKAMSLDGNYHEVKFSKKSSSFTLDANVQATLSNIILTDFNTASISYGDSNATITYSDNVKIKLLESTTINSGDNAWNFTGNSTLDLNGQILTVSKASGLTINGASKTLYIKNGTLKTTLSNAVACLSGTSRISLENVSLIITDSAGFTFATGYLDILDQVTISSTQSTTTALGTFTFSSGGNLTIASDSKLTIQPTVKFSYQANPTTNSDTYSQSKRHIIFSSPSSTLLLDGCMLESTTTAIAFDSGTISVKDKVTFSISSSTGAEAELSASANLNVLASAYFDIQGPLIYTP